MAVSRRSRFSRYKKCLIDTINILKVEVENLEQRVYGDIDNIHRTYTDKTSRNSKNYADAREELVKEMAEMATWVGRLEGILYALRDGSYKLASQAEYQALEELVRTNTDSLRQIGYDIKEIERVASGGY